MKILNNLISVPSVEFDFGIPLNVLSMVFSIYAMIKAGPTNLNMTV